MCQTYFNKIYQIKQHLRTAHGDWIPRVKGITKGQLLTAFQQTRKLDEAVATSGFKTADDAYTMRNMVDNIVKGKVIPEKIDSQKSEK
jgi:hypothetical protein